VQIARAHLNSNVGHGAASVKLAGGHQPPASPSSDAGGAFAFSSERLARIAALEGWHFWFAGRRVLVDRLLARHTRECPGTIFDLGCGTGSMLAALVRRGHLTIGLDRRPEGLRALREVLPNVRVLQADAMTLPLAPGTISVVTLLDVLEHVDDKALLVEVHRVLRSDGRVILTAPALPGLWSYRDEAAGHLRRYTPTQLRHTLGQAGFEILEMRWYQCLLLPIVITTRLMGRRRRDMRDLEERRLPILNTLLSWLNKAEAVLGDAVPWPFGSSLVAVGRRP
jgi:SAM-dependent methyltransferase